MLCRTGIDLEIHGLTSDATCYALCVEALKSQAQNVYVQLINPEQTERDDHALDPSFGTP